ncbi:MAG: PEP-CTERM system histidine kinase PrsK [candidate division Zixibacteria bacterium]|nr:PEP-CTERM system histidine kinase PrsK [candidate division Zixibacteria bacterium]
MYYILYPSAILLPTICLLFSLTFARENYHIGLNRWKWWLGLTALLSVLLTAISFYYPPVLFQADAQGNIEIFVTSIGKWGTTITLVISSFVLINAESTFRAATGIFRRRLSFSFVMITLFFAFIIIFASSVILYGVVGIRYIELIALVSLPLFPSIARYLRTYQLQGSGVFIKRQAVYSSVGVILIGVYLILVGAVGKALQLVEADVKVFYSILAAFLVIILFMSLLLSSSVKRRIKRFVDRSFYSGAPVDYHENIAEFAEDISTTLDVSELVSKISDLLKEKLEIDKLWLYLQHPHLPVFGRVYPVAGQSGENIDKDSFFVDWIFRHGEAIALEDLSARLEAAGDKLPNEGIPEASEVSVCLPLVAKHNIVGLLFFGRRRDDKDFGHQDIQLISAVGNQFALAVLSARLSEELLAARQIESFHKFSAFVMHDLKNSISMLSMLMQNFEANVGKPEFQKSAFVTIQGAVTRMQSIISKLKGSESVTAQTVSNCNLADIVVDLREKLGLDGLDGISYSEQLDEISPVEIDADQLSGVIENLIVNAIEAMPHGGELTIPVTEDDGMPSIEVKDSGVGMEPEFINKKLFKPFETTKKKGLGIGLYQSRDQLERMGGRFKVTSKLGQGTGFKVFFPLGERSSR